MIEAHAEHFDCPWQVELADSPDRLLAQSPHVIATADSAILDRQVRWFNLARAVVEGCVPQFWRIDLQV
jgi:hypothetical protein